MLKNYVCISINININRPSVQFLLMVILSFAAAFFLFMFVSERHFVTLDFLKDNVSCGPVAKGLKMTQEVDGMEVEQVITMAEDGRLGNLLMEMATLYLIGRQANVTVSLLPQVVIPYNILYPPLTTIVKSLLKAQCQISLMGRQEKVASATKKWMPPTLTVEVHYYV